MKLLQLALRELRFRGSQKMFSAFFVLNLCFGLFAFLTVVSLKLGLEKAITEKSRESVGADLSISARRDLTDAERKLLRENVPEGSQIESVVQIFSMIRKEGAGRVRLAQVKGIPPALPFAGRVILKNDGRVNAPYGPSLGKKIWVDQALSRDLEVVKGDRLLLGGLGFEVGGVIEEDSAQGAAFSAMGPKILIARSELEKTGLVGLGSISTRTSLVQVPVAYRSQDTLAEIEEKVNRLLEDPAIRVRSHTNAAQESTRLFQYLSDYLGLVSLAALALSALGVIFQFRRFLRAKMKGLAVLRSLGATRAQVVGIPLIQVLFLGLLAGMLAGFAAMASAKPLEAVLNPFSPYPFQAVWEATQWGLAIGVGTLGAALVVLPELLRLQNLQVSDLFRESRLESQVAEERTRMISYTPMLLAWTGLAVYCARSWKVGLLFSAAVLVTGWVVAEVGRVATVWMASLPKNLVARLAFRRMLRSPGATRLAMVTLGISTMLMNLLPQLKNGIETELTDAPGQERPSLFLFDIQDDQKDGVDRLVAQAGMSSVVSSPFIRSRLLSVNGTAFEKEQVKQTAYRTREDEQEQGLRNRGINLTYRQQLTESEKMTSGRAFTSTYSGEGPAEVSVEKRFGERLGLKLGDQLKFDIQGVEIEAKIVNFRKVKWTSFLPNFFIQFQEGVLNETPKTFLNAIRGTLEAKNLFLDSLVAKFPNVSAIDVSEAIRIFKGLVDQITLAITWMAAAVLVAGLMTLGAMIRYEAVSKTWQMNLFRVLGGSPRQVIGILMTEIVWVAGIGSLVGAGLGFAVSYAFTVLVFEGESALRLSPPVFIVLASIALGIGLTFLASRSLWKRHPREILHQEGS